MVRKKYFYCGSTQALLYALALDSFIIISKSVTATKLCSILGGNQIKPQIDVSLRQIVLHPFRIKKEIQRLLGIIQSGELHFSHTQFAVFAFLLVQEARKKNIPVYFHDFEFVYPIAETFPRSIKNIKLWFMVKIVNTIYSIELVFKKVSTLVPAIDDNFIQSHNISVIESSQKYFETTLHLFSKFPVLEKSYHNLFLTQNLLKISLFKKEELIEVYKFLKEQNVSIKLHPGMKEHEAVYFKDNLVYDNDLPAEFYFNSLNYAVISVHSAALITASYFDHLKSISLLSMLNSNNPEFMLQVKDELNAKSLNKIYFPATLEELQNLLDDKK